MEKEILLDRKGRIQGDKMSSKRNHKVEGQQKEKGPIGNHKTDKSKEITSKGNTTTAPKLP